MNQSQDQDSGAALCSLERLQRYIQTSVGVMAFLCLLVIPFPILLVLIVVLIAGLVCLSVFLNVQIVALGGKGGVYGREH